MPNERRVNVGNTYECDVTKHVSVAVTVDVKIAMIVFETDFRVYTARVVQLPQSKLVAILQIIRLLEMKERKATRDSELKGSELTVYHTAHSIR
jgi:hypothetical protein